MCGQVSPEEAHGRFGGTSKDLPKKLATIIVSEDQQEEPQPRGKSERVAEFRRALHEAEMDKSFSEVKATMRVLKTNQRETNSVLHCMPQLN